LAVSPQPWRKIDAHERYVVLQKKDVAGSLLKAVDAVSKALLKSTHLNEETRIVTESLTASVRTLEPSQGRTTVIAQSQAKSDSVVYISPDVFSFIKHGETDIFQTRVH